ncbi:hypothetical protein HMPREF0880_00864 [Yokenella regensburgei ATCC 43003]|nr:hypothetical protein HMPREF0880_00864 [Yokenella regensburgei ATCC 43003]
MVIIVLVLMSLCDKVINPDADALDHSDILHKPTDIGRISACIIGQRRHAQ